MISAPRVSKMSQLVGFCRCKENKRAFGVRAVKSRTRLDIVHSTLPSGIETME